jgi:hypothetical protein
MPTPIPPNGTDPSTARKRRVVVVEYDVTSLTADQVDALLLHALVGDQDVSFRIETAL